MRSIAAAFCARRSPRSSGWEPLHPHFDPAPAFANALANARGQGVILFVSDEQPESLPAGVTLLAFGKPIENVGFAGARTWRDDDGAHWEAIVKNAGATPQERNWTFETDSVKSRPQIIRLAPGQIETINGPFPNNERHLRVRLTADGFPLDDELPLVAVEPKPLKVAIAAPPELAALFDKIIKTVPAATRTEQASKPTSSFPRPPRPASQPSCSAARSSPRRRRRARS